ncbi:MAG TPA: phage holin family protein [Thermoanaerobaculia bacterium]|nr:phage holin family protein [Thermoanaerobaculia bacterium]
MTGWIDLFRSLGESLLEVLRAELAALQEDFQRSGRHFGVALGLFGGAAILVFWTIGLLLFALIAILHVWLPLWGAALIVLGLFVLAIAILGYLGARRMRQVENPLETVRRRMDNHLDWWQHSFLTQPRALGVDPAANDHEPLGRDLP